MVDFTKGYAQRVTVIELENSVRASITRSNKISKNPSEGWRAFMNKRKFARAER